MTQGGTGENGKLGMRVPWRRCVSQQRSAETQERATVPTAMVSIAQADAFAAMARLAEAMPAMPSISWELHLRWRSRSCSRCSRRLPQARD